MTIWVLTLFPEVFENVFSKSIIKRAQDKKIVKINYISPRNFGLGKHKKVDDKPYGGGKGMVMMVEPIEKALETIKPKPYTILLAPNGKKYAQHLAKNLAVKKTIALICGRYEGIDARVENISDEVVSIGDYVLSGGEIPAMVIIDSITRLLPGTVNPKSPKEESFEKGLLEYPQYTRPENYKGQKVPKILLTGNHAEIEKWRKKESEKRTRKLRPDLQKES